MDLQFITCDAKWNETEKTYRGECSERQNRTYSWSDTNGLTGEERAEGRTLRSSVATHSLPKRQPCPNRLGEADDALLKSSGDTDPCQNGDPAQTNQVRRTTRC